MGMRRNAVLAYQALDYIKAHPEEWDQSVWECGTVACFAGWVVRLSGTLPPNPNDDDTDDDDTYSDAAARLLGFSSKAALDRASWREVRLGFHLFYSDNTLKDLEDGVAILFGPRPETRTGTHLLPCGCLPNEIGAHRGSCPDFETIRPANGSTRLDDLAWKPRIADKNGA